MCHRGNILSAAILGIALASQTVLGLEVDLRQLESAARELPKGLVSIRCKVSESGAKEKLYELFVSGDKFRSNFLQGSQISDEFAFDGEHRQRFHSSSGRLDVGRAQFLGINPYGFLHPFAVPYFWLLSDGDSWELASLRNDDLWRRRFNGARLVGRTKAESQSCILVEFDDPRRMGFVYKVYFAEDLKFYPIKWEGFVDSGSTLTSMATVSKWRQSEDKTVVVPLVVSYEDKGYDKVSRPTARTISILEDTLAVNGPIDDGLFTLSRARARHVIDVEAYTAKANSVLAAQTQVPISTASTPSTPWTGLGWIVANVIFIAAILSFLLYRTLRKSRGVIG